MIVIHVLQEVDVKMVSFIIHLVFIFRKNICLVFLLKIGYWFGGNLNNNVNPYDYDQILPRKNNFKTLKD